MPPLSFCYWRCYSTEPKSFRKMITLYAGHQVSTIRQIATDNAGGIQGGVCTLSDDMYYCGASSGATQTCEKCDYDF